MELLRPQLDYLRSLLLGLPRALRESWPLNRIPRSRDWEVLIITYLVAVTIALIVFFLFTQKSFAP
jgi:hypothetical protein